MTEIRVTLPLLVTTVMGLMLFATGWLFGYATLRNEIEAIRAVGLDARAVGADGRAVAVRIQESVFEVEKRLIVLEGNSARISQDVAEMRLRQLPKSK